jgi:hypothetical protein
LRGCEKGPLLGTAHTLPEARVKNPKARVLFAVAGLDPDTPEGRAAGLLHIAKEFLSVGNLASDTYSFAKYFLVYHAIETALKAYLARSGMTERKLEKLGHDIMRITAKAERRGFTLRADEKTVLNAFECSNFKPSVAMRYKYFGSPSCPTFENLMYVADAIVSRAA